MSDRTTKKARAARNGRRTGGDLAGEYRFDDARSRANRFAKIVQKDPVVVVLEADVARVFRDPVRVNRLLRATIAAVQKPKSRRVS